MASVSDFCKILRLEKRKKIVTYLVRINSNHFLGTDDGYFF